VVGALPGQASADVDERASTALLSSLLFGVPVALLAGWGASTVAYMNADSAVDYPYGWETLKAVGGGLAGDLVGLGIGLIAIALVPYEPGSSDPSGSIAVLAPPVMALVGGVTTVLLFGPSKEGEATSRLMVSPMLTGDGGGGMVLGGTF